jgi:hypothetical protein
MIVEVVAELRSRQLHQRHEEQRERQVGGPWLVRAAGVHLDDEEDHVDRLSMNRA